MTLVELLKKISEEYPVEKQNPVKDNKLRYFIENKATTTIKSLIKHKSKKKLNVYASAQQGVWLTCPWIIVCHQDITNTAQKGYYAAISFSESCEHIVFHIGQGETNLKDLFKRDWKKMSKEYSLEMFLEIKNDIKYLIDDPSNFKEFRKNDKKRLVSKFGKILEKSKLHTYEHLNFYFDELINLYLVLVDKLGKFNDDIIVTYENLHDNIDKKIESKELKTHKRLEYIYVNRNRSFINKIKSKSDYNCEACNFNFKKFYNSDIDYIEAHHLIPVSELKIGEEREVSKKDFAFLCANCHRMIHKLNCISLQAFKNLLKKN